jgi:hypothetical protein
VNGVVFPQGFQLEPLKKKAIPARNSTVANGPLTTGYAPRHCNIKRNGSPSRRSCWTVKGPLPASTRWRRAKLTSPICRPTFVRKLPRRALPVAIVAWLGVSLDHQGQKLGSLLVAQSLRDCHVAGQTFAFVAVILDCVDDRAKSFYQRWDFAELPGNPFRLFLNSQTLTAMMTQS